ncbi:MAG: hypothetical protein KAS28_08635, partial [Desulfobacula sp.]|nr:hypothetical protein [Desulfobacula sp.]
WPIICKLNGLKESSNPGNLNFFDCYKKMFGLEKNVITQRRNISYKEFSKDITYWIKCIPDSEDGD